MQRIANNAINHITPVQYAILTVRHSGSIPVLMIGKRLSTRTIALMNAAHLIQIMTIIMAIIIIKHSRVSS